MRYLPSLLRNNQVTDLNEIGIALDYGSFVGEPDDEPAEEPAASMILSASFGDSLYGSFSPFSLSHHPSLTGFVFISSSGVGVV